MALMEQCRVHGRIKEEDFEACIQRLECDLNYILSTESGDLFL